MPGGSEFIVHTARLYLDQHPDWTLAALDTTNAFGTVSRQSVRQQLQAANVPHTFALAYFDRYCLPPFAIRHGSQFEILAAEGVIQGDPLSPLFFALALQPSLISAQSLLTQKCQQARIFSYLDDICLIGPPSAVAPCVDHLKQSLAPSGLHLNGSKTLVYSPQTDGEGTAQPAVTHLLSAIGGHLSWPSISLLGSEIKHHQHSPTHEPADIPADIQRIFSRLDSIPSLQARLLLLRVCISRSFLHSLRTTPPSQSAPLAELIDARIARSIALLCASGEEPMHPLTLAEARLPIRLGGLGIPDLHGSRTLAYSSSVMATMQAWRKIIPDQDPIMGAWSSHQHLTDALAALAPSIAEAASILQCSLPIPTSASAAVAFTSISHLQRRLQGYVDLCTVSKIKQEAFTSAGCRSQYLSKTSHGAGAWLNACATDSTLRLSNEVFQTSIRLWLRLPLLPYFGLPADLPCVCSASTKLTEEHIMNCNFEAARDTRHNTIVLCFKEMLESSVHSPVLLEPRAAQTPSHQHRFDLSVSAFDSQSRHLKADITIRNPQAKHLLARSSTTALQAADEAVKEKNAKYGPFLTQSDLFLPLAIETFGGMHSNVVALISKCARRVGNVPPDSACFLAPGFAAYWTQRISCTLQRENARLVSMILSQSLHHAGLPADSNATPSLEALDGALQSTVNRRE
jgi:hypothetical protein